MAHLNSIRAHIKRGQFKELPMPKHGSSAVRRLLYIKDLEVLCVVWVGSSNMYAYQDVPVGKAKHLVSLVNGNRRIGTYINSGIKAQHLAKVV